MLPPYYSYWFRIDNKHMTEPWLVKALMDPANRSAWRNPNKRHNSKLVFPINDNYCCLNSYQLRNEKRGKNLLQIEQWKLKRKLRNLRSTTLGWKNIRYSEFLEKTHFLFVTSLAQLSDLVDSSVLHTKLEKNKCVWLLTKNSKKSKDIQHKRVIILRTWQISV